MELISRVKAVIRRSDRSKGSAGEVLKIGELVLDEQKHEVYARGQAVSLTFKEFELLSYLMKNRGWCSLVIRFLTPYGIMSMRERAAP